MKASTIRKTTWDSTLQFVAGLAWLLSIWALAASAGEVKTAVVPQSQRGTAQGYGDYIAPAYSNPQPAVPNARDRYNSAPTYSQPHLINEPTYDALPADTFDRYEGDTQRGHIGIHNGGLNNGGFNENSFGVNNGTNGYAPNCPNGNCNLNRPNYEHLFNNAPNNGVNNGYQTAPQNNGFSRPFQTNRPVFNNPTFDNTTPVSFPTPPQNSSPSYNFQQPFNAPANPYATPAPGSAQIPTARERVEYRYSDPLAVQLGRSATVGTATNLYLEASNLIDTRHVSPLGYEARTTAALEGLATAIETPAFHRAAGVNVSPNQVANVQQQLRSLAQRPARSSSEAIGQMQQATSLVNRSLGIPQGLIAMEFVHANIDALDRFSAIVPRQSAMAEEGQYETASVGTDLELRTAGLEENIVGVGVEMKADARGAIVLGTVDGGPAQEAGVQSGDIITAVNGRTVAGMSLAEIAQLIGGSAGTDVTFTVDRNGRNGNLSMTRRSMYVSSVASVQMIDRQNGVGYARLKQFSNNSAKDLQEAMWKLHNEGMQSIVLDLRGNPGGLLTSAIEISDLFLPCGSIVSTRGRNADDNTVEKASYSKTWKTPLVVLIDDGSASASEILAAAIQDNERGVIVGRRSYGKGTVQTHFPLRTVTGNLKLTTAKFYSPKGREMADAGVIPDVNVNGETDRSADVTNDRDLQAAISTLSQGRPQQLAANAAKCNTNAGYSNAGTTNGYRR